MQVFPLQLVTLDLSLSPASLQLATLELSLMPASLISRATRSIPALPSSEHITQGNMKICSHSPHLSKNPSVRIAVFSSAIVIDVIVHCHTAGALLSQTAENNCPYHRVVGF